MALAIIVLVLGFTTDLLPPPLPARHREARQAPPAAQPTSAARGLQAQAGRPFNFGNTAYTVEKTGRASELRDKTAAFTPSGTFLLILLSVTNEGGEPLRFKPSDFALYDKDGRHFSALREASRLASSLNEKKDIFGEALQPGLTMEALLVFDVPREAEGLTLRLFHGYLDVGLGR